MCQSDSTYYRKPWASSQRKARTIAVAQHRYKSLTPFPFHPQFKWVWPGRRLGFLNPAPKKNPELPVFDLHLSYTPAIARMVDRVYDIEIYAVHPIPIVPFLLRLAHTIII